MMAPRIGEAFEQAPEVAPEEQSLLHLAPLMSLNSRDPNPYALIVLLTRCQDFPEHLSMAGINPELRRQVINVYKGTG